MPERLYTLRETCILLGMHQKTVQKWDKEGKIRVVRTLSGRRNIPESEIRRLQGETETRISLGYARVSSGNQKDDLERQVAYLRSKGISEVIKDVGSGLNEKRRGYAKLLWRVLSNEVGKVAGSRH